MAEKRFSLAATSTDLCLEGFASFLGGLSIRTRQNPSQACAGPHLLVARYT